jgi:hypothetical protein
MMIELDAIFASDLSLMVFLYGSAAMFISAMAAVTWICRTAHTDVAAVPVRARYLGGADPESAPINSR